MDSKSHINIVSGQIPEFSSDIQVDDVTYHVQTEDSGRKKSKIQTRVFFRGEVVFSRTSDYSHLVKLPGLKERVLALMEDQHKNSIALFQKEHDAKKKVKNEYFAEAQMLLKKGNGKSAIKILEVGLEKYPADPFLLSYYGCLIAVVEKRTAEGIKMCQDAIGSLGDTLPFGSEFFYPAFYLNLGRALLKGNQKEEAIAAFAEGLRSDPENHDLLWEMKKLGTRKRPVVPFLKRSNPINKYIGKLLHKISK